ncbi:MAG: LamG domain-containing protein, partial [Candidatus Brocadiales bacterium]|nr:LamG domain-containing protein [Candidatus Brocadiales bacterium]
MKNRNKLLKVLIGISCITILAFSIIGQTAAQSWTELMPTGGPPLVRTFHSAVHNPDSNRMIMFGGQNGAGISGVATKLNDVWVLENADGLGGAPNWIQLSPSGTPPSGRGEQTTVYDAANNRMIMFAGNPNISSCHGTVNDVWVLENADGLGGTPNWIQLSPTGVPPTKRGNHSASYDPSTNRMITFGGNDACGTFDNQVWVLTNANGLGGTPNWTQLIVAGAPSPVGPFRFAVYDPVSNRMIVMDASRTPRVWVLEKANGIGIPNWTELSPTGVPPTIAGWGRVYDSVTNRLIVTAGTDITGKATNEVWILENANGLGGTSNWLQLNPIPVGPNRGVPSIVLNSGTNRMTMFGGNDNNTELAYNDTWVLADVIPVPECIPAPSGLISWWDADSVSGTTVTDIQGGNAGTLLNGATTVQGIVSNAFSLFGKDDYVEVPSNPSLQFDPSTPFSIEGWINVGSYPATDTVPIVAKWGSQWPEFGYGLLVDVNKNIQFSLDQFGCCRNNVTGTSVISENTWYHFAATYDATTMRIYINGALEGSAARTVNGTNASVSPLYIGNQIFVTAGDVFTVLIDELGIYSSALPASDIQAIYNAGSAGKCKASPPDCVAPPSGMVSWWDGDSVSGATATDIQGSNDGTLSNGATTVPGKVGDTFSFDGINDYVVANATLDTAVDYTVDFWMKPRFFRESPIPIIMRSGGVNSRNDFEFMVHLAGTQTWGSGKDRIQFQVAYPTAGGNNGWYTWIPRLVGPVIPEDEWTHVASTYDASSLVIKLYVNGVLVDSKDVRQEMASQGLAPGSKVTAERFTFGADYWADRGQWYPAGQAFPGELDEIELFNRALTASEIQDIYNAGSAGKCKDIPAVEDCSNGIDDDGDGLADCDDPDCASLDNDGDGAIDPPCGSDCDHNDPNKGSPASYYEDADNDGYGNPNSITQNCDQPAGYVTNNTDNCLATPVGESVDANGCSA